MEQSQLIELIRTLSSEEKEQVLIFYNLSISGKGRMRTGVLPLLEICLSFPWDENEESLDKITLFNALYPGQDFVEGKLEKVMVDAHKVIRGFLLTQKYFKEDNEFQATLDFAEIVRVRGLELRYQQSLAKLQKIQNSSKWRNDQYFNRQLLVEKLIHGDEAYKNQSKGYLNIPNTLEVLEIYYLINQLTLLNFFLLQKRITNISTPEHILPMLDRSPIVQNYLLASPQLRIAESIFWLLKKEAPSPGDVRDLFNLLIKYEQELDAENLREFYTYLRNICVMVSNTFVENEEIRLTLFDLYKDNLLRGYLHFEGKLHSNTYLAVSLAAIRVKQFDWALGFIENYKDDILGENETQDIYRFNKAQYFFGVGRFSECLDFIPATSPFVNYLLQAKRLELKVLYELKSDLLSYKLDAFRMFLSRTSQKLISDHQKNLNSEFVNLLTQLSTSIPGDLKRAERMISRIQEKKQAAEWRWLLEKAQALKTP